MYYKSVVIGASTGGPSALRTILKKLPKDFPLPIIIVQRIPQGLFAESLAEALNGASEFNIRILSAEDSIQSNEAVLIPGGYNLEFENNKDQIKLVQAENPENDPAISFTLQQVVQHYKAPAIFVVLTGICLEDNLIENAKLLSKQNGYVITQKPSSCFIDDLPQTVIESGVANEVTDLTDIWESLVGLAKK